MRDRIIIQPMQWASNVDLDDIRGVSAADYACLKDIRDVLAKYGNLGRFGISLIHKYFDLADDECLVETFDYVTRTLTIRPAKKANVGPFIETQWLLQEGKALLLCERLCLWEQGHRILHHTAVAEATRA